MACLHFMWKLTPIHGSNALFSYRICLALAPLQALTTLFDAVKIKRNNNQSNQMSSNGKNISFI